MLTDRDLPSLHARSIPMGDGALEWTRSSATSGPDALLVSDVNAWSPGTDDRERHEDR